MLCEICKINQATIHIQEFNNGEKKTIHICDSCASKKGLDLMGQKGINIAEFLYKLSASSEKKLPYSSEEHKSDEMLPSQKMIANIICPKCGWESKRLQETGRLGCEECYKAFSEVLTKTLSSMHKGIVHTGKCPEMCENSSSVLVLDILNLQKQLELHVKREEYEEAAKLRDRINELQKDLDTENNG